MAYSKVLLSKPLNERESANHSHGENIDSNLSAFIDDHYAGFGIKAIVEEAARYFDTLASFNGHGNCWPVVNLFSCNRALELAVCIVGNCYCLLVQIDAGIAALCASVAALVGTI